ncbi:MAG TPA: hypothetical protein VMU85_05945 [Stellaceae bacterium]|nr:hypothetical protein [Stellaceae bacterium]
MKAHGALLAAIVIAAPLSTAAQINSPLGNPGESQIGRPAKVDHLQLNPSPDLAGTCHPTRVRFNGSIHATGPLTVTYQWLRSDNKRTDGTINFELASSRAISTDWNLTTSYTGWMQLVVISPKRIESPKVHFRVNCG